MAGGGGSGGTTVSRTELDPTMRPYVQYGLSEAQRLYSQPGMMQYYPGQTYIGPSQQTQAALQAAQQRAMTGSPLVPAAQQQTLKTIQGEYLGGNPFFQGAFAPAAQAAERQYQSSVNQALSNFSRAGRYGSGAMTGALGQAGGEFARALTGTAGQLAYANYADERARQMAAMKQHHKWLLLTTETSTAYCNSVRCPRLTKKLLLQTQSTATTLSNRPRTQDFSLSCLPLTALPRAFSKSPPFTATNLVRQ